MSGPLKEYEVELPGGRKTTMKLNEADAEHYGATAVDGGTAAEDSDTRPQAKARGVQNKSRTASTDKGDG